MDYVEDHRHTGMDSPNLDARDLKNRVLESEVVKLTGDQTVAGVKTFSSIPILPATSPTTDNQAVRKAYADSLIPGYETITSTTTRDSADAVIDEDVGATYVKVKEIEFNEVDGELTTTLYFEPAANTAYARIYINGVAAGTERELTSPATGTYNENFDVETGDLIQVYGKGDIYRADLNLK